MEIEEHWEFVDGFGKLVVSDTPENLWKNAVAYFRWNKENPIIDKRKQMVGKNAGENIEIEHPRALSVKALCMHCNITEEYIVDTRNSKDKSNPYYIVVTKILYIIHTQNLEYAMLDIFNPIFTAKVLNMEKEEAPTSGVKVEIVGGLPELLESENEIIKKLELENPDWVKSQNGKT